MIASYEEQLKLIWQGVKIENIDKNLTKQQMLEECKKQIEDDSNFENAIVTIDTEALLLEVKVREGYIFQIRENEVQYIRKEGEILKDIEVTLVASKPQNKKITLTANAKQVSGRQIEYIVYINGEEKARKTTYENTLTYEHPTNFGDEINAYVEIKYQEEKTSTSNEIAVENNIINDKEELIAFRDKVNSGNNYENKTVELVNDVDLQGTTTNQWTPIGSEADPFKGTFEGNYHTIENLYIHKENGNYQGLFGYIENATIQDIILKNVDINIAKGNGVGGIAGVGKVKTIARCGVEGTIEGYNRIGRNYWKCICK